MSQLAVSMVSSGEEPNSNAEDCETSSSEDVSSATASGNHSPMMIVTKRPKSQKSQKSRSIKTLPSYYVAQPVSNSELVLARSSDSAAMGSLNALPFHDEFKIIQSPPLRKTQLPWHKGRHVIFLLGRGMVAKYIPTFLYFWLCRYEHGPPHQNFDRADLRNLQEFNRIMKLLYTIVTRWWSGSTAGRTLFETDVVTAWNEGQQLFFDLLQLLLLAQSRAFAMTGRKETDAANWVRVGGPHEREGKLFFRQLNDEDLGFNVLLSEFDRWNNACWTWLGAPGSESLLF